MDTNRILTSMLIAGVLMLAFMYFTKNNNAAPAAGPISNPMYADLPVTSTVGEADAATAHIMLGSVKASDPDKLAIEINPVTAGIESAKLNVRDYAATVENKEPLTLFQADGPVIPFATIGVHVTQSGALQELGYGMVAKTDATAGKTSRRELLSTDSAQDVATANSTWILDRQYLWKAVPPEAIAAGKGIQHDAALMMTLDYGTAQVATLTKTFHEDPDSYEVIITHTIKNLSDQPIKVAIDQLGAPQFERDDPRSDDRFFHADSIDSTKGTLTSDSFNLMQAELTRVSGGTRYIGQFEDFKNNPYVWAASSNRFFAAITRPLPETGSTAQFNLAGRKVSETHHVGAASVDLITAAPKPGDDRAILRFIGAAMDVPAHGEISEPITVYLGPKKRETLRGDFNAAPGSEGYQHAAFDYVSIIQISRGCYLYSFCVFDWLIDAFLWALKFLKNTVAFGNYGLAIMILVVMIRALLHPLTRASQINMAKMGKKMKDVQPKVDAIKKKYADNKKKQSEEMMRVYRENNVNPAGGIMGCLPMLLQTPIWIAAWSGIASDIDLRHTAFIPGWISDLSNPDTVIPHIAPVIGHPLFTIPLVNFDIYGLNPLPLLLAVVMFINMKVTMATQPRSADPQQAQMQKLSSYTIFILPLVLYNASSGLNLYYFASTMAGLVDTYFVRKSLKRQGILPATALALPTHEEEDAK